jgi:hypothetical protein
LGGIAGGSVHGSGHDRYQHATENRDGHEGQNETMHLDLVGLRRPQWRRPLRGQSSRVATPGAHVTWISRLRRPLHPSADCVGFEGRSRQEAP